MLQQILSYYSFLLSSIVIICLSGILITKTFNIYYPVTATKVFIDIFFGLISIVSIYSIIVTSGFTINLGFLLLSVYYFIYKYFFETKQLEANSFSDSTNFKYSIYFEILVIASILFIAQSYSIVNLESNLFYTPYDPDRIPYADIINWLNNTGIETTKLDYQNQDSIGLIPYHFFQLWLTSAIVGLFSSNTLITDHLVTAPLLGVITYTGFRAISDTFKVPRLYSIVGSFIAVALCFEIQIPFLDNIPLLGRTEIFFQQTVIEMPKLFSIYLFQIAAIIFYFNKKIIASLLSLAAMPVASILMTPPILLTIGIMLIIGYYKKIISRVEFFFGFASLFSLALFILIFYQIIGNDASLLHLSEDKGITNILIDSFLSITSVNIVIGTSIQIFYLLFPYILIAVWMRSYCITIFKNVKIVPVMLLCIFLAYLMALCSWAVLNFHPEAHQILERYAHIGMNLVAFLIIMIAYGKSKYVGWIVIIAILLIKLDYSYEKLTNKRIESSNLYSTEFIIETQNALKEVNPIGAQILAESDMALPRFGTFMQAHFYSVYNSKLYTANLTDLGDGSTDNYLESFFKQRAKQYIPFYKFVNEQVLNNNFVNINKSQYDFVIKNNIEYLTVSPNTEIPSIFNDIIIQSYKDKNSGVKLYILNSK